MSSKTKATAATEDGIFALVPKLRFPEFRSTEGWKLVTLQEASVPVTERVGKRKLTPVSISAGVGFVPQADKFGRDISGNQYELYTLISDGDFAYNKGNSLRFPQGCVYLLQGWGKAAAPNVFISFRLKGGFSNVFFQNCFDQNMHGKQLKKHITSGARSNGLLNISRENFFGVEIPTPRLIEQEKVAECLSSIDAVIAAKARKLDALTSHKSGLLQQVFPREGESQPRLRFLDFQGKPDWLETTLGQLAKLVRGPFGGSLKKEIFVPNGYAVYEQQHAIYSDFHSFRYFITAEKYRELRRFAVAPDDIIMSCSGTMGRFALVPDSAAAGVINQALLKLTPNEFCDSRFLKEILELPSVQEKLLSQSAGGAIKNVVSVDQIRALPLRLPGLEEQKAVATCVGNLHDLIAAEAQMLEALKTYKRGLMQQLFPSLEEEG